MVQPVFASSYLETLQARAHQKNLSNNPYWHRLLHDRRNLLGVYQSEIDDPSFFLSPRGRRDSEAELEATIAAFFQTSYSADSNGTDNLELYKGTVPPSAIGNDDSRQSPQCRYPARYAWLKEELSFDPSQLPEVICPRYEKWKAQMDPGSVSLVFASYFMNNPASTYGHTFLRLNAKGHTSNERLLDYAVNFAADLESDNGLLFALKGLWGGYHGRFSTFPYYMKVQEYNNLESRDLWEYDLHIPPARLERLLQHLWELGNTRFRYFFLNKNCSYYLLPVLDVMDPSLSASRPFVFKAIPIDTVRQVIRTPGMLEGIHYRPSHATKMIAARKRLSETEVHLVEKLLNSVIPAAVGGNPSLTSADMMDPRQGHSGMTDLKSLPPERQALVLDSAYDLFRYKVGFHRDEPEEVQEKEQQLLLMRNQIKTSSPSAPVGDPSIQIMDSPPATAGNDGKVVRPDLGHKTGRIDLSYGFSNHSHFDELSIRPALHSQDDPTPGYLPGSQLEMFHLKLRYDNDRKTAYVQDFALVDLISITPWDRWIHPPSWKVKTGLMTANELKRDPENSLYYGLNLGTGYAFALGGSPHPYPLPSQRGEGRAELGVRGAPLLFYGMVEMDFGLGHAFGHDVRFGGGPTGGILYSPCRYWRARFQIAHDEYAVGGTPSTTKLVLDQSVSVTRNMEIRTQLQRQNTYKEVMFSWVWFL